MIKGLSIKLLTAIKQFIEILVGEKSIEIFVGEKSSKKKFNSSCAVKILIKQFVPIIILEIRWL